MDTDVIYAVQRFNEHPIHDTIERLREKIRESKTGEFHDLPMLLRSTATRALAVLREVQNQLSGVNPMTVSFGILDWMNNQLDAMNGQLDNYFSDPQSHQDTLEKHLDPIAQRLAWLGPSASREFPVEGFTEHLSAMQQAVNEARKQVDDLGESAATSESTLQELGSKAEKVEQHVEAQTRKFDEFLDSKTQTFNDAETERSQKFQKTLEEHSGDFQQSMDDLKEQMQLDLATAKNKCNEFLDSGKSGVDAWREESEEKASEVMSLLDAKLEEAKKIVGKIVTTGTAGVYENVAERELSSARWMRRIALACFLGMVALVGWFVYGVAVHNDTSIQSIVVRFGLGALLTVPGVYCAREANKHWKSERFHRRMALEMATIRAYLDALPPDIGKEVLARKADEYYGNRVPPELAESVSQKDSIEFSTSEILDLIKATREN